MYREGKSKGKPANPGSRQSPGRMDDKQACVLLCVCMCVNLMSTGVVYHTYNRWTVDIHANWWCCQLTNSDLGLFWHDSCRYKVRSRVRYDARCIGVCVWLSCQLAACTVSWMWLMHCMSVCLTDDVEINRWRCNWYQTRDVRNSNFISVQFLKKKLGFGWVWKKLNLVRIL